MFDEDGTFVRIELLIDMLLDVGEQIVVETDSPNWQTAARCGCFWAAGAKNFLFL